jgi:hypothetical protein
LHVVYTFSASLSRVWSNGRYFDKLAIIFFFVAQQIMIMVVVAIITSYPATTSKHKIVT